MVRIAVCDNNELDKKVLCGELEKYFKKNIQGYNIQLLKDSQDIINIFEQNINPFDLIFLDIFMKHMNGIEIAKHIRTLKCNIPIIFITSSIDFVIESYDVAAYGYLLKPIESNKLVKFLNRFLLEKKSEKKILLIKSKTKQYRVFQDDIVFVESKDRILNIHVKTGEIYETYKKMTELEAILTDSCFLRCHQSYLINFNYVKLLQDDFTTVYGDIILVRRKELKKIKELYYNFLLQKYPLYKE